MSSLILVEHNNNNLHAVTRSTLAAALQLDEKPILCVIGYGCEQVAKQAAALEGAHAVWYVDEACYAHQLAENVASFLVSVAASVNSILAPATTFGKNILPRVAAKLDVTQISDVSKIIDKTTFEHPIYASNAVETVRSMDAVQVLTIRSTAFKAVEDASTACPIERMEQVFESNQSRFVEHTLSQSKRPDLSSAKIIVSGGRALKSAENFKLIDDLADALGAAVGASRAAVDAGFVPNDYQVGQTGKVVAPLVYFAIGISGAVQHLAGMKDSKVIVAINQDEDAPIFQVANYGLVGDLFVLVPQLIEKLKETIC